uniref:Uncharacterized protein n=1 Tax=Arundo donax TaxID=35708 RepID=A0A0A8YD35_ARUDO
MAYSISTHLHNTMVNLCSRTILLSFTRRSQKIYCP